MNNNLLKNLALGTLVMALFFVSLEAVQRVRYALRYDTAYWLLYGFAPKPDPVNYYKMQLRGLYGARSGTVVKIPRKFYDGYSKFDPDYPHSDYKINKLGFRAGDFNAGKSSGIYRIAVIGDSTVFGLFSGDDQTFPAFLERDLKKFNAGAEVLNLGIPSYTTANMKNLVKSEVIGYHPDMIIIYGFFNDVYYSNAVFRKDSYFLTLINSFLLDHSVFYLSFQEKMCKLLKKDIGMLHRGSLDAITRNLAADNTIERNIEKNMNDIIAAGKEAGIRVIIAKQALYLTDVKTHGAILESDRLRPFYNRIYAAIDDIGRKAGVAVIDSDKVFDDMPDKAGFFADGVHLTAKGNELLAGFIADKIKDLIPPPAG